MSNFTAAEATALFEAIRSRAKQLAIFAADVPIHDPDSAPPDRLNCSIALGPIRALPEGSGLGAVSGEVTLLIHVWSSAMQRPRDAVDPAALAAVCALMGALAGGFTLGNTVRDVDILAMHAQPAYANFEGKEFRVVTITLPIVIDDMFEVSAL